MSTVSGSTVVLFGRRGFIVLAYTNNGLFRPTCMEIEMIGCTLEEVDWESCLVLGV